MNVRTRVDKPVQSKMLSVSMNPLTNYKSTIFGTQKAQIEHLHLFIKSTIKEQLLKLNAYISIDIKPKL